jgi:hypothetical protein
MRAVKIITGVITIIFLLSVGALITSKVFLKTDYWKCKDGQWMQIGNPSEPMPNKECLVDEKNGFFGNNSEENDDNADNNWPGKYVVRIEFSDDSIPLYFRLPLSWQGGPYEEEIIEEENGIRRAKINYLGENDKAMLFMINILPKSMDIYEIENMPNNKTIGQNVDYYYTLSESLDVPFEENSKDYETYIKMIEEVEIVNNIIFSNNYEMHDIKINENNEEENFKIDITYPRVAGPEFDNNFSVLMEGYTNGIITEFKDKVSAVEINEEIEETSSILKLNYNFDSVDLDNDIVTVSLYGFEKIKGNENRNILSKTFKYDLKNDKELDI